MKNLLVSVAKLSLFSLAVVSMLAIVAQTDAKAATGKQLFAAKGCTACHGAGGKKPLLPTYPKLAGQNAPYLVEQLKAFKGNKRTGGQAAQMAPMAAGLSEAEIKLIANYLSKVK